MKKVLIIGMMLLSGIFYAQISFEKAYFINNNDEKTDCFIKNIDWKNNPTDFEFKKTIDSQVEKTNIKQVKEFGIYEVCKYERHLVDIDTSSTNINNLSDVPTPLFKQKELFLKVLVEGNACLYRYENDLGTKYFYKTENTTIKQLIYKKAINQQELQIIINNDFRKQLWTDLKFEDISMLEISKINYTKSELINLFEKYNHANSNNDKNFITFEKQRKLLFNLNAKFSISNSSLKLNNVYSNDKVINNLNSEVGVRFGLESEFILPYNKNKWAIIIEPTYQQYKTEKKELNNYVKIDYKSIELPLGIRHYMFLNEKSKIFINFSYIIDFSGNSKVEINSNQRILEIESSNTSSIGLGYKFKDKYSIEFRQFLNRNILGSYLYWNSNYSVSSLVFGYNFLNGNVKKKL